MGVGLRKILVSPLWHHCQTSFGQFWRETRIFATMTQSNPIAAVAAALAPLVNLLLPKIIVADWFVLFSSSFDWNLRTARTFAAEVRIKKVTKNDQTFLGNGGPIEACRTLVPDHEGMEPLDGSRSNYYLEVEPQEDGAIEIVLAGGTFKGELNPLISKSHLTGLSSSSWKNISDKNKLHSTSL